MIVDELNIVGLSFGPSEHDAPLVVDTNAVKPRPVSAKQLEAVARRGAEVEQSLRCVDEIELTNSNPHDVGWELPYVTAAPPVEDIRCSIVAEGADHRHRSYRLHGVRAIEECGITDRRSAACAYLAQRRTTPRTLAILPRTI